MTYATLMIQMGLGHSNTGLLQFAGDLAERFEAHVIGIVACQPMQFVYGDEYVSGDVVDADRKEIDVEVAKAEADFRAALQQRAKTVAWRSIRRFSPLSDDIAREARRADLVVTHVNSDSALYAPRCPSTSDLVMQVGRPVLIVPKAVTNLALGHAVVAWKDTRETRRAAFDALPLLRKAERVTVVEIAAETELAEARKHLEDVVLWLARHGIAAQSVASLSAGDDARCLNAVLKEQAADIVVAGAYGHSRTREWALGGVTHDLLLRANQCSLVSH